MRRTPEKVSRERQKLAREIAEWEKSIKVTGRTSQQVAFGESQLAFCRKQMTKLRWAGKRKFWV